MIQTQKGFNDTTIIDHRKRKGKVASLPFSSFRIMFNLDFSPYRVYNSGDRGKAPGSPFGVE